VASFLNCVRAGAQPANTTTLADSLKTMAILDQVQTDVASRQNKP
jgi:hypothetical protein